MQFLKSFGVHILTIAIIIVLLLTGVSFVLNGLTRHGESLTVPDIKGMRIEDAERALAEKKLRFMVTDSMYFADKPKLSVLEQNPVPQSKVKEGRVIYITLNADAAPMIPLPNLIDVSMRQASAILLSAGLKAGKLIYKPDIAQNVVLDMMYRGRPVAANTRVPKGSTIDLVLGDGMGGADVPLPDLEGLTLEEANNLLSSSSLNIGSVVYEGPIRDSASAKVSRQVPAYSEGVMLKGGHTVDLYLEQE